MITIQELTSKKDGLVAEAKAIQDVANGEKREMTPEEVEQLGTKLDAVDQLEKQIAASERLQATEARQNAPQARKVLPDDVDVTEPPRPGATTSTRPARPSGDFGSGQPNGAQKGLGGFRSVGEYALSVKAACIYGPAHADNRLKVMNAASTYGSEGVGADGGYAVPPDFRTVIMKKVAGEDALLSYCEQLQTSSNSVTVPVDESTPWQTSGGILSFWAAEGTAATASKPALKSVTVKAEKLLTLVPVTDELLQDASAMEAYLRNKVPDKINYKINDAFINGDGNGKPTGILQSPAIVSQPAEGGQTAGTVVYNNITKMFSRMPKPQRANAIWIVNQDIEPQLFGLTIGTSQWPAYLPAGGISDKPYATLLGKPVVYTEACQPIGTVGDILFVDPTQYLALMKGGGVKTDVSIHLYFDQDATAFRFVLRVGGLPWWTSSIARAKSSLPLSAYVSLAAR